MIGLPGLMPRQAGEIAREHLIDAIQAHTVFVRIVEKIVRRRHVPVAEHEAVGGQILLPTARRVSLSVGAAVDPTLEVRIAFCCFRSYL